LGGTEKTKVTVVALLALLLALEVIYLMPCILFPFLECFNPAKKALKVKAKEPLLIIADLHLIRVEGDVLSKVRSFIVKNHVKTLVIAGDLFHRPPPFVLREKGKLDKLVTVLDWLTPNYKLTVYFTPGNHDPHYGQHRLQLDNLTIFIYREIYIETKSLKILVIHGDQMVRTGMLHHLINRITGTLLVEKLAKKLMGLGEDTWLVMGHSHIAGIDFKGRVANPGSLCNNPLTAILVENKTLRLINLS